MDDAEVRALWAQVLADVERTTELLAAGEVEQWRAWMAAVGDELRAGDPHGVDRLLGAYGGMGSYNDVGTVQPRGGVWSAEQVQAVNAELDRLRERMYVDAKALRGHLRATG